MNGTIYVVDTKFSVPEIKLNPSTADTASVSFNPCKYPSLKNLSDDRGSSYCNGTSVCGYFNLQGSGECGASYFYSVILSRVLSNNSFAYPLVR